MEAWREELYHGLLTGLKTNANGTWKQHKYIRKEGNKYIYPEDLKKKLVTGTQKLATSGRSKNVTGTISDISKKGSGLGTGPVGNTGGYSGRPGKYTPVSSPSKRSNDRISKIDARDSRDNGDHYRKTYSNDGHTLTTTYDSDKFNRAKILFLNGAAKKQKGRSSYQVKEAYSKKKEKQIRDAVGNDFVNYHKVTQHNDINGATGTYELTSTLKYENGKQWFDKIYTNVDVNVSGVSTGPNGGVLIDYNNLSQDTKVEYIVSRGKLGQAYDKGMGFVKNKIFGKKKG